MIAFFHWFGKLHRRVYALHGALGRRFAWIPCLVLTTTGRKSGAPHTTPLLYHQSDDGSLLLIGANGTADWDPDWVHNLRDEPKATFTLLSGHLAPVTERPESSEKAMMLKTVLSS